MGLSSTLSGNNATITVLDPRVWHVRVQRKAEFLWLERREYGCRVDNIHGSFEINKCNFTQIIKNILNLLCSSGYDIKMVQAIVPVLKEHTVFRSIWKNKQCIMINLFKKVIIGERRWGKRESHWRGRKTNIYWNGTLCHLHKCMLNKFVEWKIIKHRKAN